jgi:hypothetical protein
MNMNIQQMAILADGDDALMTQLAAVYNGTASDYDTRDLAIHFAEKFGLGNINPQRMMRALRNVKAVA